MEPTIDRHAALRLAFGLGCPDCSRWLSPRCCSRASCCLQPWPSQLLPVPYGSSLRNNLYNGVKYRDQDQHTPRRKSIPCITITSKVISLEIEFGTESLRRSFLDEHF